MGNGHIMAMLIIVLLLASNLLLITGNQLDKEIAALRIKIEKQDAALRWLENVTQAQNEKITSLNEQLQQGLEDHDLEIDMMQNKSDGQQKKLEKLQEDFDLEIDMMQNESSSQQEQLKNVQGHLEEHDIDIDIMQNTSNIQEEQLESLTAENRKLHGGDSLVQQQIQDKTDTLNAKLQNVTNEMNARIQNEKDQLTRSFTDKYNNMQKGIKENKDDISKLNRGLISYRTWGTHGEFVKTCLYQMQLATTSYVCY